MAEFAVDPSKIDLYGGKDQPAFLVTWRKDYESRSHVHKDKVDEWIAWFRSEERQFNELGMKSDSDPKVLAEYSSKYDNMKMIEKEDVEEIVDHFEAQASRYREQTEAKKPIIEGSEPREGANTQGVDDGPGAGSDRGPQSEKHLEKPHNSDNVEDAGAVKVSGGKIPQSDGKELEKTDQKDHEIIALNSKIREMEEALEKANNAASEYKKKLTKQSIDTIKENDSVLLSSKLRDRILFYTDPEEIKRASFHRFLLIRTTKIHIALNEALYLFQRDGAYMNNLLQRTKDAAEELCFDKMFAKEDQTTTEQEKLWMRTACSLGERCLFWAGRHMFEVGLRFKHEYNREKSYLALRSAMDLFEGAQEFHGDEFGGDCNCDIGPIIEEWKEIITKH